MIWDNGLQGRRWFFQTSRHFRKLARKDARLGEFKPTHIYVRTYASCLAARELAKKTGAKLVYSMRGADVSEQLLNRNFRGYVIAAYAAFCVRRAARTADHVNSVSRTMAQWIKRKWHREPIDFAVLLSSSEGLAVMEQEAFSYGIPVACTDVGGARECVNSETGLLLPANVTADEFVSSFIPILEQRRNMRIAALKMWSSRFDSQKTRVKFVRNFDKI